MYIPGVDPYDLALEIARGLYQPDQDNDLSSYAPLVRDQLCLGRGTLRNMKLPVDTFLPLQEDDDSPSVPLVGRATLRDAEVKGEADTRGGCDSPCCPVRLGHGPSENSCQHNPQGPTKR